MIDISGSHAEDSKEESLAKQQPATVDSFQSLFRLVDRSLQTKQDIIASEVESRTRS